MLMRIDLMLLTGQWARAGGTPGRPDPASLNKRRRFCLLSAFAPCLRAPCGEGRPDSQLCVCRPVSLSTTHFSEAYRDMLLASRVGFATSGLLFRFTLARQQLLLTLAPTLASLLSSAPTGRLVKA